MKKNINMGACLRAAVIFLAMFALIMLSAFIKYRAYGSFDAIRSKSFILAFSSSGVCVLLVLVALFTYMINSRSIVVAKTKELAVVCSAVALSCITNIFVSMLGVFYMPMAFCAYILAGLSERRDVFIANIISNLIVSVVLLFEAILGTLEGVPVVIMMILGVFIGSVVAYSMSGIARRVTYVLRGLFVSVIGLGLLLVAALIVDSFNFMDNIGFLVICAVGQPLLALMLQPIFESVFNILTNAKLNELTDHNAPLMKMLVSDALGTFNHSLSVASFAEVCAMRIGENPYMAKACAYYHDVGKLKNPGFFSENQSGYNPHDELLPEVSATILRAHTTDGYELCLKHRIPKEIASVTLQHHGTLPMAVFYAKAKRLTDSEVDSYEYSYHGDEPVTKIAAIIMICDACEAALRAMSKPTSVQIEALVSGIINDRIARGQLDNCDITMRDLDIIKETIIGVYGGVYHKRVQYPEGTVRK